MMRDITGAWVVDPNDDCTVVGAENGHWIAEANTPETARLIAAAPALLQFARNALAFAESCGDEYGAEQARAVIAQAEGRPQ